jgi:hypothetical protein
MVGRIGKAGTATGRGRGSGESVLYSTGASAVSFSTTLGGTKGRLTYTLNALEQILIERRMDVVRRIAVRRWV